MEKFLVITYVSGCILHLLFCYFYVLYKQVKHHSLDVDGMKFVACGFFLWPIILFVVAVVFLSKMIWGKLNYIHNKFVIHIRNYLERTKEEVFTYRETPVVSGYRTIPKEINEKE